ncbi:MAG: TIGR02587 family membrane protein [Leptolyngbya sp.]|jgi:putative integral membrane protein (TIGR02587 family)|uniref:TIGR02587 family membrane protein n=1 Tax=Shackletoniella antarctica TaxID=268115 RepID=A0A2W4WKS1_9CYAN|nr:MAG: TIGR02587 family membrane protein [Shackletoniella antarctica]PZV21790.1 MAG: TIGR02587 family membrane protein [Leptolyngbya sp.]
MDEATDQTRPNVWLREFQAILQGAVGGFLFGIPSLYTVEVWSIGEATTPRWLLLVLTVTLVGVGLLTQVEGFRQTLSLHPLEAFLETIEAVAIGTVCATLALVLLCRITLDTPLSEALGKVVFETVPFSLGVALARSTLQGNRGRDRRTTAPISRRLSSFSRVNLRDALVDFDAALIGAVLIAFSIAPTEEVPLLASSLPPLWLLLILAASLGLSYAIVFASGFADRAERRQRGLLFSPITETLVAYLVALLASVVMLVLFQQLNPSDPWSEWLSDVLVLGLPASIGGAAGRILI